jgi:hypothetical protein
MTTKENYKHKSKTVGRGHGRLIRVFSFKNDKGLIFIYSDSSGEFLTFYIDIFLLPI